MHLTNSYILLLKQLFLLRTHLTSLHLVTGTVAAVTRLPALHYSVDFIFLPFWIIGFIVELWNYSRVTVASRRYSLENIFLSSFDLTLAKGQTQMVFSICLPYPNERPTTKGFFFALTVTKDVFLTQTKGHPRRVYFSILALILTKGQPQSEFSLFLP